MRCLCCHKELVDGEEFVCLDCLLTFPLVDCADEHNPLWTQLSGQVPFERATHLGYYQPGDNFSRLIAQAKYDDRPQHNAFLANLLCDRLEGSGWPYDVDVIVPVPVHWRRILQRGYNQVSPIVRTLEKRWHLPVMSNCLMRSHYTMSQVGMGANARQDHQRAAFTLWRGSRLTGKHVLLVDDVCTTGSTLVACAALLQEIEGVRVSVLTLAKTFRI